jgi:hypothetical protein
MIDVKEAYRKVYKEHYEESSDFRLCRCVDIGNRWVFWFTTVGFKLVAALQPSSVNKETGDLDVFVYFFEEANMKLVKKGIEIPIEEILA